MEGAMEDKRDRSTDENLDELMERDTEIRRDTQVRGSLGVPPSGSSGKKESTPGDEAIPEFGRMDDEDRTSER
jgi:hypothetical protein